MRTAQGQTIHYKSLAGGTLASVECRRCGRRCAWAISKRTGKAYLCETVPAMNDSGARRAVPWQPHRCRQETEPA